MAFPTLVGSIAATLFSTLPSSTTHNKTLPTPINAGDLLVVVTSNAQNVAQAVGGPPAGWTLEREITQASWLRQRCYTLVCDGTEDGATVNFATASATTLIVGLAHFAAGTWTNFVVSTGIALEAGNPAFPDPDEVTALVLGDHRFMVVSSCTTHDATSAPPTGYTENFQAAHGTIGDDEQEVAMNWGSKEATASSDNPGTLSFADPDHTVALTMVVEGLALSVAELHASGTGTVDAIVDETDATSDLHLSVDDDPATPNDADWINNA